MRAGAKLKVERRIFRFCIRARNICTDGRHVTRTRIYRRESLDKRALAAAIFADKNRHARRNIESAFPNEVRDSRNGVRPRLYIGRPVWVRRPVDPLQMAICAQFRDLRVITGSTRRVTVVRPSIYLTEVYDGRGRAALTPSARSLPVRPTLEHMGRFDLLRITRVSPSRSGYWARPCTSWQACRCAVLLPGRDQPSRQLCRGS